MAPHEEREMHDLAVKLEVLTRGCRWEAMRYWSIAQIMQQLTQYCSPDPPAEVVAFPPVSPAPDADETSRPPR